MVYRKAICLNRLAPGGGRGEREASAGDTSPSSSGGSDSRAVSYSVSFVVLSWWACCFPGCGSLSLPFPLPAFWVRGRAKGNGGRERGRCGEVSTGGMSSAAVSDREGRRGGESPEGDGATTTTIAARSSILESLLGCGISGIRIDKEELRRKILMPEYLRVAMSEAIRAKDPDAGVEAWRGGGRQEDHAPEAPMVVFVNSSSGGRLGHVLKGRLQELMGAEQVIPLPTALPHLELRCLLQIFLPCGRPPELNDEVELEAGFYTERRGLAHIAWEKTL